MVENLKSIELDTTGLDQLIKALKNQKVTVRVGILKGTNSKMVHTERGPERAEEDTATLGYRYELGVDMPERSFLRMPLSLRLQKALEDSGAFTDEALRQVIRQGSFFPWMTRTATLAESVVADAFETHGYGRWPPATPKNENDLDRIRSSITHEIVVTK
jgi:hypothetical protein